VLGGVLVGAVLVGACASQPRDRRTSAEREAVETKPAPQRRWQGFPGLASLRVAGEIRSAHPAGDFLATIRVNPAAETYGTKGRQPLAPGALIVEGLADAVDGPPHAFYVMERREPGYFPEGGDWAYLVVSPTGVLLAEGKLKLCARCHAEAPREHLFEPVRSTLPGAPPSEPAP
jgi:hypothetical protein